MTTILPNQKSSQADLETVLVGISRNIQEVRQQILSCAENDKNVLVVGETGTGKYVVAEQIHKLSSKSDKEMVHVSVPSLPETLIESELFGYRKGAFSGATKDKTGRFEEADGGTLFLDEIGDMPTQLQSKLLIPVEKRKFYPIGGKKEVYSDFRLISATNQSLDKIRKDLHFRISQQKISILPLRERKEDILPLTFHFLSRMNKIDNSQQLKMWWISLYYCLMIHLWQGNVRELMNECSNAKLFPLDENKALKSTRLEILSKEPIWQVLDHFKHDQYGLPAPSLPDDIAFWGFETVDLQDVYNRVIKKVNSLESWMSTTSSIEDVLVEIAKEIVSKPRYDQLRKSYQAKKEQEKPKGPDATSLDRLLNPATTTTNPSGSPSLADALRNFASSPLLSAMTESTRSIENLVKRKLKLSELNKKYVEEFIRENPITGKHGETHTARAKQLGIDQQTLRNYLNNRGTDTEI